MASSSSKKRKAQEEDSSVSERTILIYVSHEATEPSTLHHLTMKCDIPLTTRNVFLGTVNSEYGWEKFHKNVPECIPKQLVKDVLDRVWEGDYGKEYNKGDVVTTDALAIICVDFVM